MSVTRLLAQMVVSDEAAAASWYEGLFGRGPDARPMDGLLEWHLGADFGVQVWADPARAGRSAMVLDESDLDARVAQLDRAGVDHGGPVDVTASRLLAVTDPDGNQVMFTGAFAT